MDWFAEHFGSLASIAGVSMAGLLCYTASEVDEPVYHRVARGETLHEIYRDRAENMDWSSFKRLNRHIAEQNGSYDRLYVGDSVRISSPLSDVSLTHWSSVDDIVELLTEHPGLGVDAQRFSEGNSPADHGLEYETVDLHTIDNVRISGYYTPRNGEDAVVLLHGKGMNNTTMLQYTDFLAESGYSVLQIDFRAHGHSSGTRVTYGAKERLDVKACIQYLQDRGKEDIGVLGNSLGASTGLISAADYEAIDAVIAESPYAQLANVAHAPVSDGSRVAKHLFVNTLRTYATLSTGIDYFDTDPLDYAHAVEEPVLLIHGTEDRITRPEHSKNLHERVASSELWLRPGRGHVPSQNSSSTVYEKRVLEFFASAL